MIDRSEILAVAADLSLEANVVEKDYVLGWLLAGIYSNQLLAEKWVFKGGTCLKKCFFETYRFSEDLDFTLTDPTQLDGTFLLDAFRSISQWIYNETGLELPGDQLRFDVYQNAHGGLSCEGRVYYIGPLQRRSSLPRIKLDLTADEILTRQGVRRVVWHPYTDCPPTGITAFCYAYEELFGEKIRALGERARPRDLYDVINLFWHTEFRPLASEVLEVLRQKCNFKSIALPTYTSIASFLEELRGDWQNMLAHQLPVLPPFESFWNARPEFFAWLESALAPTVLEAPPVSAEEHVFRPAVGVLRLSGVAGSSALETIRFAAANRLCVDLGYNNELRRIEPYSLRRTRAGNILLFAIRSSDEQSRSYRLDRIQNATVTEQSFSPRYAIELTPGGAGSIPPLTRSVGYGLGTRTGPTYTYECYYCERRFPHSRPNSRLSPHKAAEGWDCPGRIGYLVDIE